GKCVFHDFTVCDCGNSTKTDIACQGKPYKTKNISSRTFHSLAYEIACEAVIAKAKQIIHEELGCCHTSIIESTHNVLLQFRTKNLNLHMIHYCFHFTWAYYISGSLYVGLRLVFQDSGRFYDFQTFISLLFYVVHPYQWLR
uniref:Uncharacterized protein n=1 Tax=Amphimedon queenslandica TaxID=400682 RepID=A0A1X7VI00_AMPQE